jgi:hypothetical protein
MPRDEKCIPRCYEIRYGHLDRVRTDASMTLNSLWCVSSQMMRTFRSVPIGV